MAMGEIKGIAAFSSLPPTPTTTHTHWPPMLWPWVSQPRFLCKEGYKATFSSDLSPTPQLFKVKTLLSSELDSLSQWLSNYLDGNL